MDGKTVAETKVEVAQLMQPQDANLYGNVHGGTIMKLIDNAGSIVAFRHAHTNIVTASVDRIDFYSPVYVGNLIILKASVNYVGHSSMEVGVRVEAECLQTGNRVHCASAFLTFVALDGKGNPTEVPPLILETADDQRRWNMAQERREGRLTHTHEHPKLEKPCTFPVLSR
jgi:acyl-CoA hydrolase